MRSILVKIVLIIPVLLICTGVTASEYRSDFPVFLQDTIIHTDSLTFTGKEEVLKSKARKRDNGKPHSPHRATIMAMVLHEYEAAVKKMEDLQFRKWLKLNEEPEMITVNGGSYRSCTGVLGLPCTGCRGT